MVRHLCAAALLAGLGALALPLTLQPAKAAPAASIGVTTPDTGVQDVAMRRKKRRMMSSRAARMRDSGNARNPSRPVMQQNQGGTTGGPRY